MAYKPRIEAPGAFHHVVTRGNNRRRIFEDDWDREIFLTILQHVAAAYGWTIWAYCLMTNHYHLVIQVGDVDKALSRGMCFLNTAIATEYNGRHGRINHLFGKRYWNRMLRDDGDVITSCRYAINNPVRAGMVGDPELWVWSSYRATLGMAVDRRLRGLVVDDFLRLFSPNRERAITFWKEFVDLVRAAPNTTTPPRRE